jgi:hypothetical protein
VARILVQTQPSAETAALEFSRRSLAPPNGTAVAAAAERTPMLGHPALALLEAKAAVATVLCVQTAMAKVARMEQVAAPVVVTAKVKAVMAEVALSSSRMFSQRPLQPRQSQQRQYVRQPQQWRLRSTLW